MEANNDTAINFELIAERRAKEAAEDNLDAQRYRKLKVWLKSREWSVDDILNMLRKGFNGAVDALPDPETK